MINARRIIYRTFSVIAVAVITVTIFLLSAQTAEHSSATSGFFTELLSRFLNKHFSDGFIRTCAHFCEYAGLGFFVCNLIYSFKGKTFTFISSLISWVYAWSDEIHQLFVPGRAFQISDLAVDLGGVIIGSIVFTAFVRIIGKHRKSDVSENERQ